MAPAARRKRRTRALAAIEFEVQGGHVAVASGPEPSDSATRTLHITGIEIDHPRTWSVNDQGWLTAGFGRFLAITGTQPRGPW